ncbi:MAG TPA: RNA polymerase subunit sigma-70, partial [Solirubrobacteraceae bacterium]|nr:RNA polymerase subunit sigma-70 [Solirubrobacteraceae bacterium]
ATALRRARGGDEEAFRGLVEPYRRELQLHCYRILGSLQDAEDLLQETLLAAWCGLDSFEGRASMRSWLYRIATNRCLNARRDRGRRVPGSQSGSSVTTRQIEPQWLEPYPDVLLEGIADRSPGPDTRYEKKEAVALAFITFLQYLAPHQRAVLVLRDVLGFSAGEVAGMLDTTAASVNSALQRARATLDSRTPVGVDALGRAPLPGSIVERKLLGQFADALENGDADRVVDLLNDDALLTMPPVPGECRGRDEISAYLHDLFSHSGERPGRLVATRANGQPAFARYVADAHASLARFDGLFVLALDDRRVSRLTHFTDTGLLPAFGLPRALPWSSTRRGDR